jgi:hypothetical protein
MQPGQGQKVSVSAISGAAEATTKLIAGIGLLALATAFLYDFVYWAWIDRRMLTFLVVADHIQTAVYAFAIIVFAVGGVFFCTWLISLIIPRITQGNPKREKWLERLMEFAAFAIGSVVLAFDDNSILQIGVIVIWLSLLFRRLFMPDYSLWPRVIIGLIVWFAITAFIARSDAIEAKRVPIFADVVSVETGKGPLWDYELKGRVLRLIDRGAILRSKDGRISFVPKERVLRVDQNLPDEANESHK